MLMLGAALAVLGIAMALVLFHYGVERTAWPILLLGTATLPLTLLGGEGLRYVGIAPSAPSLTLMTATVLGLTAVIAWTRTRAWSAGLAYGLPLMLWLALGFAGPYEWEPIQVSGIIVLVTGLLAFAAGYGLSGGAPDREPIRRQRMSRWASGLILLQLAVVVGQLFGYLGNRASGPQASDLAGRAYGTLDHPNQLAKTMVLLTVVLLFTMDTSWRGRNVLAPVALLSSVAVTAATQGRAGFVALLATVGLWSLLLPASREAWLRRCLVTVGVFLVAVMTSGALMRRYAMDPRGGARDQLTDLAMYFIRDHALIGVGPNSYVYYVGHFDPLTASGVPVHNSFLMSALELGVPGAILLWGPLALGVVMAVSRFRRRDVGGSAARAVLAVTPAIVLIGMTGWGTLLGGVYPLLWFMFGYFIAAMKAAPAAGPAPSSTSSRPRVLVRA